MRPPFEEWFGADAFDATYGYDEEQLLKVDVPDEPDGFAAFWSGLYERALGVRTAPALGAVTTLDGHQVAPVRYSSLDGVRLGGWVTMPAGGTVERAVVVGHGYGGRSEPDLGLVPPGTAAIFPVARGLPAASLLDAVPSASGEHVLHGIAAVETYVHGGCAADVWCAASALLELVEQPPLRLGYVGTSFGGGIGAMAVPWDPRFTAAVLQVPSFGHHELRLQVPCAGAGESVRLHVADHPEVREVLRFFDAATAARRLRIPTLVAPALWDPAVPPPGQFAVYNAIEAPKELVVLSAGHAEYPTQAGEQERYVSALREFLTA